MRGITIEFNDYRFHTGNDLDLVQEVKEIGLPSAQSYLVEVPGRNGLVNLTKGLSDRVIYNNRDLKFEYFATGKRDDLQELLDMFTRLHGETVRIIDDDTPDYFYTGEVEVESDWVKNYLNIILSVDASPFRVALYDTVKRVSLSNTEKIVTIRNSGVAVEPTIVVNGEARIMKGDKMYSMSSGTYTNIDLLLLTGVNEFTVSGSGYIEIRYKEARI